MDPILSPFLPLYCLLALGSMAWPLAAKGAIAALDARARRRLTAPWRAAMESQGLSNITESWTQWEAGIVTGHNGPSHVRMAAAIAPDASWIQIEMDSPRRLLAPLVVQSRRTRHDEGTPTGDDAFDRAFCVTGSPADVHALLDAETRSVLMRLGARGRLEVTDGMVRLTARENLAETLGLLLSATRGLPTGLDLPQRLAGNASRGPASIRVQSLLKLSQEFRDHPLTRKTLEAACADPSPEVRLRAALELGEEHLDVALAIAEGVSADDTSAANAVYALGARLAPERATAILEAALRTRRLGTAHACLERLRSVPDPAAAALLAKVLAIERGELAVHAARALADGRSPDIEAALVAALAREADVRQAAAEALGVCGTPAAVLPLRDAEQKYGEPDFQRAARQAIASIQSRVDGASPGQLSIASAEAGQVSLAETEAGHLSFPPKEGGEVSLADDEKPGHA